MRVSSDSERKVKRELLEDLKRVTGKQNLLFALIKATPTEAYVHRRFMIAPASERNGKT